MNRRPRWVCLSKGKSWKSFAKLKKNGVGVIFISHNLNDIFQVSDRILVLRRGEKVGERLISQTNHDEVVRLMDCRSARCQVRLLRDPKRHTINIGLDLLEQVGPNGILR